MGGQRRLEAERCAGCGLHVELCACAQRPSLDSQLRVIVVQNNRERHKPTNTGRMIVQVLRNAELLRWGVLAKPSDERPEGARGTWRGDDSDVPQSPDSQLRTLPFDESPLLRSERDYFLIFPRIRNPESEQPEPAPELSAEILAAHRAARPEACATIVLLDGTWAQCSRMSRRIDAIAAMDAYGLPEGPGGHWGVRTASEPGRISTFEAAIRVFEIAGEVRVAAAMQEYFDLIAARMQYMKGKLPRPEVPREWIEERTRRFGPG